MRFKNKTKSVLCAICQESHDNVRDHHDHLLNFNHQEQAAELNWRLKWKTEHRPSVLVIHASFPLYVEFQEDEKEEGHTNKVARLMNHISKETGILVEDFCGSGSNYLPKKGYLQFMNEEALQKVVDHFQKKKDSSFCCIQFDDNYVYLKRATDLSDVNWNMEVDHLTRKYPDDAANSTCSTDASGEEGIEDKMLSDFCSSSQGNEEEESVVSVTAVKDKGGEDIGAS